MIIWIFPEFIKQLNTPALSYQNEFSIQSPTNPKSVGFLRCYIYSIHCQTDGNCRHWLWVLFSVLWQILTNTINRASYYGNKWAGSYIVNSLSYKLHKQQANESHGRAIATNVYLPQMNQDLLDTMHWIKIKTKLKTNY